MMVPAQIGGRSAHNLMVDSVTVRNFRSFNEVKVDGFKRINVLVGENGSGKTALLEAIFLAAGVSPELAVRTRGWRGAEGKFTGSQEDIHRALWADLFHKFQSNKPAFVQLRGKSEENRSVTVSLKAQGHVQVIAPSRKTSGAPVKVLPDRSPIDFKWRIQGQPDVTVAPYFKGDSLVFPPAPSSVVRGAFFAANRTSSAMETVNRFSKLSRKFLEDEFIERFGRLYPRIRNLSVEVAASAPALFATVEGIPEKIPISLASGGMNKLASILLAMSDMENGIVLVDEIENGFFHRRLPEVWRALRDFSIQYNCQLFLSTHSGECLQAAAELAAEHKDEFLLLRTVLQDGETRLRQLDGQRFTAAVLEENMDPR